MQRLFSSLAVASIMAVGWLSATESPKSLPEIDKLKIREAQLAATTAYTMQLSAQIKAMQAQKQYEGVLVEVGRRMGCLIDEQTAECTIPKTPAAEKK